VTFARLRGSIMSEEAEWRGGGLLATCGVVWRSDGVTMVRINACDRPISVTASQRLNGVSPNPNPQSVEVGDILLCPPELGLRGPSSEDPSPSHPLCFSFVGGIRSLRHLVPSRLPCRVERERDCSWQNTTYPVRELHLAQTCGSTSGSTRSSTVLNGGSARAPPTPDTGYDTTH
jgi:hypothetical protein